MVKRVLVLRCDDRSGLAVIRSLGRAGIEVDVGWPAQRTPIKSRYVRKVCHLPDPNDTTINWPEALKGLVGDRRYDLIIPCDDHAVIPIQKHKGEIDKWAKVYSLSESAFVATFDKHQTTLLAERCGIRLPRWALIRSPEEMGIVGDQFSFPLVLKPVSSFDLNTALRRREVRTVRDRAAFPDAAGTMLRDGPVLVQAYFPGQGVGVELIAKEGIVLAAFQHERMHEPPNGGGSSYRRSVPLDESLLSAARALVAELRYTGVMMVEFRVDRRTGHWIFVEINARFWGSLPLAIVAGMNFPRYLYEMLVEGAENFPQTYKTGIYCRNISRDLSWFKQNFQADRSDPTQHVVSFSEIVSEVRNVITLSEHFDTFSFDDPVPFFYEIKELYSRALQFMLSRAKRLCGVAKFLKRRRARHAIRTICRAENIVFVCYGNICRSPFAEAYARSISSNSLTFSSAGTFLKADRSCPDEAKAAAMKFDIDLDKYRSRAVSTALIESADVIFVFDRSNFDELQSKYPEARGRIIRLGDFTSGPEDEIRDPFGASAACFEHCYKAIADAIDAIDHACWRSGNEMGLPQKPKRCEMVH